MNEKEFNRLEDPFEPLPGLDTKKDFIPSEEYTQLLNRCNDACAEILTGDVLNYRKNELKLILEKYDELFNEVDKHITQFEGYDEFMYLFDALITAYQFLDKNHRDAFFALDDYSKFDMSIERNLTNWLFAYQDLNETIAYHLNFNTDCDCNNPDYYRISHLGIHIHNDDMAKIFEFSKLYGEQYAYLLKQYMDISWDEFLSFKEEESMYHLRDNLFYYILRSRYEDYFPTLE
ncbi:hypothetical protein [Aquirufa sp. OSTEICH-129A]